MDREQLADGRLEQSGGRWCLRFTRTLRHPPEKVWRALTEPEHLAAWFPTDIHGERAAGAALRFEFRNGEGPAIGGEMITYDPPRLLEMRWGEGETLRFELQATGTGTLLTFVDTLSELGKASRDAAGWHSCLDLLAADLDREPVPWGPRERWQEVHQAYVDRFGPEASTIGPPAGGTQNS